MSVDAKPSEQLLWPRLGGPADLAEVERVPLADRGLPASTYELVTRAAALWPERTAASVLPDAERWQAPVRRTFGELAADVHRAANVLGELGVERDDAVAVISVNCAELLPLLLAAEATGIFAPINPALAAEHATELVRLAGARVIVASGPELDPVVWEHARTVARETGARALLALRPDRAGGRAAGAGAARPDRGRLPRGADGPARTPRRCPGRRRPRATSRATCTPAARPARRSSPRARTPTRSPTPG